MTILSDTKDFLNISDDLFDTTLIITINTSIFSVYQLGGIQSGVVINALTEWTSLGISETNILEVVKQIIFLRTKMLFEHDKLADVLFSLIEELDNRLLLEIEYTTPIA